MRSIRGMILGVVAACLCSGFAVVGHGQVYPPGNWQADASALGSIVVETFGTNGTVTTPGLSTAFPGPVSISGGNVNGNLNNGNQTMSFGFSPGTLAVGFDYTVTQNGDVNSPNAGLNVLVDNGMGLQLVTSTPTLAPGTSGFWGFISPTPIVSLQLAWVNPSQSNAAQQFTLDNLQFLGPAQATAAMPEPASLVAWSLIGGAAFVGSRLRRRGQANV